MVLLHFIIHIQKRIKKPNKEEKEANKTNNPNAHTESKKKKKKTKKQTRNVLRSGITSSTTTTNDNTTSSNNIKEEQQQQQQRVVVWCACVTNQVQTRARLIKQIERRKYQIYLREYGVCSLQYTHTITILEKALALQHRK